LLGLGQIDAFSLELELLGHEALDFRVVGRILLQYLITQLAARHHLAAVQVPTLKIEALIHLTQLTHPLIGQTQLRLKQLCQATPELGFELLAIPSSPTLPIATATLTGALCIARRQRRDDQ
jgi:hypothetical protein